MSNSNYKRGHDAERLAVSYLESNNFKILALNWKTKYCEVDIVAKKGECVHFVEVKSRSTSLQGGGFDYITTKKIRHMQRAAELWVTMNNYGGEYVLSAIEVSGNGMQFIEQL